MPVQRMSDGSYATGLSPEKHPQIAGVRSRLYVDRDAPTMPKNPLLAVAKSRKTMKDPATGQMLTRVPTNLTMLYRPGGLLYKGPATYPDANIGGF